MASMPSFSDRIFSSNLRQAAGPFGSISKTGYLEQIVYSNALDNIGTQTDFLPHIFYMADPNDQTQWVFFNNIRGNEIMGRTGVQHMGAENYPPFFTRAILVDVAGYKKVDYLIDYTITKDDIINTLKYQKLSLNDIEKGDVMLIYTGWSKYFYENTDIFATSRAPGINSQVFKEILYKYNIMLVGSDTWAVENDYTGFSNHVFWLVCAGGYIQEALYLDDWVIDARNNKANWIGAYVFKALPITGAVGTAGEPVIFV